MLQLQLHAVYINLMCTLVFNTKHATTIQISEQHELQSRVLALSMRESHCAWIPIDVSCDVETFHSEVMEQRLCQFFRASIMNQIIWYKRIATERKFD